MKLYATITSERASKGQGGNNFLQIDVFAGSNKGRLGTLDITQFHGNVAIYKLWCNGEVIAEKIDTNCTCLKCGNITKGKKIKEQKGD